MAYIPDSAFDRSPSWVKSRNDETHWVYVLHEKEGGAIRVGYTAGVRSRTKEHQGGNFRQLHLVRKIAYPTRKEAAAAEKEIHARLSDFSIGVGKSWYREEALELIPESQ